MDADPKEVIRKTIEMTANIDKADFDFLEIAVQAKMGVGNNWG